MPDNITLLPLPPDAPAPDQVRGWLWACLRANKILWLPPMVQELSSLLRM